MKNEFFQGLIKDLAGCTEVEAILLGGSRTAKTADEHSDFDVYVYLNQAFPVEKRQTITARYCSDMELNNQFWETEDDGILRDGAPIDLIYRDLAWLDRELERVLIRHQASLGYTTCFWSNLLNSAILYDRTGQAAALQKKYTRPYPQALKRNIIQKNYPLLKRQLPAYYYQIEKALQRGDLISVQHRLTEFLASYFDILFAVNELPHPGEKRLIAFARAHCQKLPAQFEQNLVQAVQAAGQGNERLLSILDAIVSQLDTLLSDFVD